MSLWRRKKKTEPKVIVVVHIPKTGGTSLRHALIGGFTDRRLIFDYRSGSKATMKSAVQMSGNPDIFREQLEEIKAGDDQWLIMGHFSAMRYLPFFPSRDFVTFVREPVNRVLSRFNRYVTRKEGAQSVTQYIRSRSSRNIQSRLLAGLDLDQAFVGTLEHFDVDLARLGDRYNCMITPRQRNIATYGKAKKAVQDDTIRQQIADLNAGDIALYQRVLSLNDAYYADTKATAPAAKTK